MEPRSANDALSLIRTPQRDLEAGVLKGDAEQVHDEPIGPSLPSKAEDLRGWYLDKDSGYYYHDGAGWYYHRDSGMYYGGDPQEWKSELPEDKRHLSFPK